MSVTPEMIRDIVLDTIIEVLQVTDPDWPTQAHLTISQFERVARPYAVANPTGGSLHIVVDDGNLKDSDVLFCFKYALDEGDFGGAHLAWMLLLMSKTQRGRVSKRWYDWSVQ